MPAKDVAGARRYDQQVKDSAIELLKQQLKQAESPNAAVSATAAQLANIDGGGPSTAAVRNWGVAAGLIAKPAKRTKPARKPGSNARKASSIQDAATAAPIEPADLAAQTPAEPDASQPVDLDAVRTEATAPLLAELAEKNSEIERLRDLVSAADTDLIARNKELEDELAVLRPLTELYLKRQRTNS